MDSISTDGIFHHQKLPLFIDDPSPYITNEYLNELFLPIEKDRSILLKFIRANGRIRLLTSICSHMKLILIIRNPLDSVNSIMGRFSFFGGEFHHDDFPRFIKEVNASYGCAYSENGLPLHFERELLFWYYMNRYALETLASGAVNCLRICYEDFAENPALWIGKICTFLGYPMKSDYLSKGCERVGDLTTKKEITGAELDLVKPYLEKYKGLMQDYFPGSPCDTEKIVGNYTVTSDSSVRSRPYYGMTPVKIIRELESLKNEHARLLQLMKAP
jgi:hypothetical protein